MRYEKTQIIKGLKRTQVDLSKANQKVDKEQSYFMVIKYTIYQGYIVRIMSP